MLYIVTALYEEALPFLSGNPFKKDATFPHFELFFNDSIRLLVTKTGAVRAAIAVSSLLATYPASSGDFFLSVGVAGCPDPSIPIGRPFLVQKITDQASGRAYFPELLYRSPFPEAGLLTVPSIQNTLPAANTPCFPGTEDEPRFPGAPLLYDMEGFGVYEAANTFLSTHQIAFIKIVSDHLVDLSQLPLAGLRSHVSGCIGACVPDILQWAFGIAAQLPTAPRLSREEACFFTEACAALRLSVSSQNKLRQLMLYLHLEGNPYLDAMGDILAAPLAKPCKNKKEGKHYLELLRARFL